MCKQETGGENIMKRCFVLFAFSIFSSLIIAPSISDAVSPPAEQSAAGWQYNAGKWYFFDDEGNQKSGWQLIDGEWYYFNRDGMMNSGWIHDGRNWYYLHKSGAMATGWIYSGGQWYFLDSKNGAMRKGWIYTDKQWYFLKKSGAMKIGWHQESGKWYVLRSTGAMATGWEKDKQNWYFFLPNGSMATGWKNTEGKWYFLNHNGVMQTGWLQHAGKWYFLRNSGAMATGWIIPNGKWYYLFHDGSMATNTAISTNSADLPVEKFQSLGNSEQVLLVTAKGYGTNYARIRAFEKANGHWRRLFDVNGYLGKDGFAVEMSETQMKSPRGKYTIGTAFGRHGNPGTRLPFRNITSDDVWVDDPKSALYNTWQKASQNNGRWTSAERMDIAPYSYGFVINYNTENPVPGAGSAIFFHIADRYTAGCTGTSQSHVINFLKWLDPAKNPVVIQAPESELKSY